MQELLALEKGATEALLSLSLSHYTEDCGRGRLATAIAALYENVMPEDVIVLSGVDAVIHDTLSSLVEPGMNVMIQSPEYPPLLNVPQWRGATIKSWRPSGDGLDAGSGWDLALTVDAEAIVATVPHSPFGWSPSEEWYRALVKSADERGQLLVVDEIYRGIDLTADGHGVLPSACELSEQAVIFGGLAKSYGLTGLRVGWVVCRHQPTRQRIENYSFNTNSNVCAPTELLASLAIENTAELLRRNATVARTNLEAVAQFVARTDGLFRWSKPTSGLVAWLSWHGPGSAHALATTLLEHDHILVADHTLFGLADGPSGGGLRVGLGPPDMPQRLAKLEVAVQRYVGAWESNGWERGIIS